MSSYSLGQEAVGKESGFGARHVAADGLHDKPSKSNLTHHTSQTYTTSNNALKAEQFGALTADELLAQREELMKRETDLGLRYRKLQDFAQSQLGATSDVVDKDGHFDFARDIESDDHDFAKI